MCDQLTKQELCVCVCVITNLHSYRKIYEIYNTHTNKHTQTHTATHTRLCKAAAAPALPLLDHPQKKL